MKALSIKQPWAWLICKGIKDVENRTWHIHMPPLLNYPATSRRIYVHTGKQWDIDGWEHLLEIDILSEGIVLDILSNLLPVKSHPAYFGAIIGEVDIVGCTDKSDSPWFTGPYALMLAGAILYHKPIPCKGKLGFFEPDLGDWVA